MRERIEYLQQGQIRIALPDKEHCDSWEGCTAWKNLPEDEFMDQYGNEVLAQYNIPTAEEIEQMAKWDDLDVLEQDEDEAQIQELGDDAAEDDLVIFD